MRYVLIDRTTKVVTNAIELDPRALDYSGPVTTEFKPWSPPANCHVIQSDDAEIGSIYANGVFTSPGQ